VTQLLPRFVRRTLDELTIDDEHAFSHVPLYAQLKAALLRDGYSFRVLPPSLRDRWDRALYLNLTHWDPASGGDVLVSDHIPADVVAHVAWHHLAARAFPPQRGLRLSSDVLFLGESVASAFDLYLVGSLLGRTKRCSFLETQVPEMHATATHAGMSDGDFERLLGEVAADPEQAFGDLRALLFDASRALFRCRSLHDALVALWRLEQRRFGPLLHHYELSSWALFAHTYARDGAKPRNDSKVSRLDRALRKSDAPLGVLTRAWLGV
jgi:hypothetical protein